MATFNFVMTQTVQLEAETEIEADTFEDALRELARRSEANTLEWTDGPDGHGAYSLVRSIRRDGERLFGDPAAGAPRWQGVNGLFSYDEIPDEYRALKD